MPRVLVFAALFGAVFCWGLSPVAMRYLVTEITPIQLVVVRLAIGSLFFVPLLVKIGIRKWSRRDLMVAIAWGLLGVDGYYIPVTFGAERVTSGVMGLVSATSPIWILLISSLVLKEKIHRWLLIGLSLSLLGVLILLAPSLTGTNSHAEFLVGLGLTFLAALMWAGYSVAVKPLSIKYGVMSCTSITTISAIFLPILFLDQTLSPNLSQMSSLGWFILLALGIGSTVFAAIFWNLGVSQVGASQAGLFMYLIPLISIVGGQIFLQEPIGIHVVTGGMFILLGVAIAQLKPIATPVATK